MRKAIFNILYSETSNTKSAVYSRVMTALIIASLLPLAFHEGYAVIDVIDGCCVSVFLVDYICRWITADMKLEKGAASFFLYPFTPMAIIDIVSIIPSFAAINPAWKALRALRLLRLIRAFKLIRYSRSVQAIINTVSKQSRLLLVVLAFSFAYTLICALVIFNVEPETFPNFFDAVYWSVVSLTTVGYGDLYPISEIGRLIAMVSSLMGIAIVALPAGIISAGFLDELRKKD
ncbi:MAG: potassium channel family protein [Eggerthellaceae bacterium]|nr:potassium channel family protein [Eggerthellaceae bacterium]